jgi:hypothetical protein
MAKTAKDFWPRHLAEMHEEQGILDASTVYREELEREDDAEEAHCSYLDNQIALQQAGSRKPKPARIRWCDCLSPSGGLDAQCPNCESVAQVCPECGGMVEMSCDCEFFDANGEVLL